MERLSIQEIAQAIGAAYPREGYVDSVVTDSREAKEGSLYVAIVGENLDGNRFVDDAFSRGAEFAVASEKEAYAKPEQVLYVQNGKRAHIQIGGLYRGKFDLAVVGVTGSVGKTTTKEFISAVLASQYKTLKNEGNQNNEIGVPRTLFCLSREHEAAVIEMGMSGLGEIHDLTMAVRPDVGVITSIGVSHIELLGSRENILRAKLELLDGMKPGSPLFLCGDNDLLCNVRDGRFQIYYYGITNPKCDLRAVNIRSLEGKTTFEILSPWGEYPAAIPAIGQHNVLDALAAFGVGCVMNIPPEQCAGALSNYLPAGMRQHVVLYKGITVVEDCYNASPDSMRAAALALASCPCKGKRIMVVSDMLELGEMAQEAHRECGAFIAANGIDMLLAAGPLSLETIEGANRAGMERCLYFETKEALADAVRSAASAEDVVWFKASRGMKLEEVLNTFYGGERR